MKLPVFTALVLMVSCGFTFAGEATYQSPVDGKSYKADWQAYEPATRPVATPPQSRLQNAGIRLLSTQEAFSRNIDVKQLAGFVRETDHAIEIAVGDKNNAFELMVQIKLTKDKKPAFEMSSQGDVSRDLLQRIHEALGRLPDCRSGGDDLLYEVHYVIKKKA